MIIKITLINISSIDKSIIYHFMIGKVEINREFWQYNIKRDC